MRTRRARKRQRWAAAVLWLAAFSTAAVLETYGLASASPNASPVVRIDGGKVRGSADGLYTFRGIPYAAPPTGALRWRPPQPVIAWRGTHDASEFAASCPQQAANNAFLPPSPFDEDCLYLNVVTPSLQPTHGGLPVLVWIHGGGFTQDAGRDYDGAQLAQKGVVVVTINYRLGALGFLAHPALASRPGGPTGNYGLMDQQAALHWVQRNIERFGGDRHNVTIAGESAGGLAVLAHLVSSGSRGLFDRAIVQSGAFALTQQPLSDAEAAGEAFATAVNCPDQSADCLRSRPVQELVDNFPPAAIPGVVDGQVLTESIGTALEAGRFGHVPILNGINHDEERIFVSIGLGVSRGSFVPVPPVTDENYQEVIAAVMGVSENRAAAVANEYPLSDYPSPSAAFSTALSDVNFACPALQVDEWTSQQAATFAYQFNDDTAPQRFAPPGVVPAIATHASELQYVFGMPNTPVPLALDSTQEALADSMHKAWASFAAAGNPSTTELPWGSVGDDTSVMSLASPQSQVVTDGPSTHHCSFWSEPASGD